MTQPSKQSHEEITGLNFWFVVESVRGEAACDSKDLCDGPWRALSQLRMTQEEASERGFYMVADEYLDHQNKLTYKMMESIWRERIAELQGS